MRPRPHLVLALVVVLGVLGSACREGTGAGPVVRQGAEPTLLPAVPPQEAPAPLEVPAPSPPDWSPCGGGFECATVAVPLDYADPAGPTVDLAVTRRPAADPGARRGVLAVNPGGPGASGTSFARSSSVVGAYGDRFDVVGWDPRTTGASAPLDCGADQRAFRSLDPSPDDPAERAALEGAARAVAEGCAAAGGALLAHVDSEVAARDLDQIRRALGEEQLSYLGVSYGTLIGQEYARHFPDRVRAMVLDGVVDPADALPAVLAAQARAAEGALGGLAPAYDRVAAQVEVQPLPSRTGTPVGPGLLALAAVAATYAPGGQDDLAEALARGEGGDGTALGQLAGTYLDAGVAFGSYLAVSCTDSSRPHGPERWRDLADGLAAVAPRFGPSVANELLPCAWWPVAPTRTSSPVAPAGLAPVLVSSTTGDVATPLAAAQRVAATLPGAVLLTTESDGHGATFLSPCARRVAVAYLVDLALPEPGSVCAA